MAIICLLCVQLVVLLCAVLTAQSLRFPSPPTQLTLHHRQSPSTTTIIPSSPLPSHQRTFGSTIASLMAIISLNTMMMVSSYPMAASAVREEPFIRHSFSPLFYFPCHWSTALFLILSVHSLNLLFPSSYSQIHHNYRTTTTVPLNEFRLLLTAPALYPLTHLIIPITFPYLWWVWLGEWRGTKTRIFQSRRHK